MKKVLLMILDGWGITEKTDVSAIDAANTPFVDGLYSQYPNSLLKASGSSVGLPEGQMGNSEVGHMNIGAGRIVYQDLVKINKAIDDGTLKQNKVLQEAMAAASRSGNNVHLIGLVSDGGVHSHIDHLKAIVEIAAEASVPGLFVHCFTDGRDCDPNSGLDFIVDLQDHLTSHGGEIASVIGRYYAMDRDKRWEKVKVAYDAMVLGQGDHTTDIVESVKRSYENGVTDEFILPIVKVDEQKSPVGLIKENDIVICFNFRTDRGRQITEALTQRNHLDFGMKKMDLHFVTMTTYDEAFQNVHVVFEKDNLNNTLGEVIANAGRKQIRIAETEKYPHVTFFFSGGREVEFEGERRILCPSPKIATYDLQPEMSAFDIRDAIIPELQSSSADFICLNFANPDMVGHTGDFNAAIKACETVDQCAEKVIEAALEAGYSSIVIADHGNAEVMKNPDGSAHTAHTTNLVPCIFVDKDYKGEIKDGKLGDLAPTILGIMGLPVPSEMDGNRLIQLNE